MHLHLCLYAVPLAKKHVTDFLYYTHILYIYGAPCATSDALTLPYDRRCPILLMLPTHLVAWLLVRQCSILLPSSYPSSS